MTEFHFGPAGIGGTKQAYENLKNYKARGLDAAEVEFTYGVYIKNNEDAVLIGDTARELGIELSIHAPYYVNLASEDKDKIEASKKRILECCERGHHMGAKYIVFHAAFYGKNSPDKVYDMVKKAIVDMQKIIKEENWQVKLAPETTGKKSQFGSLDELLRLVAETKCFLCVDFAHLRARDDGIDYNLVFRKLKKFKHLHCHFSGIVYGKAGEQRHVVTPSERIEELLSFAEENGIKDMTIINESPSPVNDAVKSLEISKKI